jgi:hypothetical protein
MKFFDRDWNCIFRWLEVWEKLSIPARRHYLAAQSHAATVSAEGYGADAGFVTESGLVESVSTGRLKPTPASVPFRALMAQLAKFPLFDQKPTSHLLEEYVRKHYVYEESSYIQSSWKGVLWDTRAWAQSFVERPDVRAWEKSYLTPFELEGNTRSNWGWPREPSHPPKKTWFPDAETVEAAKLLVGLALEAGRPIPLISLPERLPDRLRPLLDAAMRACARFMLLYPALRQDSFQAVIGICPVAVYLLNRPAAVPPAVESAKDLVSPAFLMEDMTRLLVEAATGQCRLNRSGYGQRLFKVIEDKLREEFVPLPPWLQTRHGFEDRLSKAMLCISSLKLADNRSSKSQRLLAATAKGRKWLAQPAADRLRELLFEMRHPHKDRFANYNDPFSDISNSFNLEETESGDFDHQAWLDSTWRQTPDGGCVALNAFLDYHARVSNPLVNPAIPKAGRPRWVSHYDGRQSGLREETIEEICRKILENFFWSRLVPLGCVETTAREDGHVWFRLSGAGKHLFGQTAEPAYGQPVADAAIVIQPNFEVVFLQPNLSAEVELSPFAERVGKQVGLLFRLTRRKAILAASLGTTAEAMLAALQKHSSKPLPSNVTEEIRSWFAACRPLAMRRSILIEAGDRETALRVQRLLGPGCVVLKDTLLEWHTTAIDAKTRGKLTEQGIFLDAEAP